VPENTDCIRCHSNSGVYQVNPEHETLACATCHIPHGSNQDYLLRVTTNTLCTGNCHGIDQLGQSHPRGSGSIDAHTGKELTCTSTCHSIHTTNPEHLLSLTPPQLCASCHTDKL
jgi:predicted CXXCH cytochrome family protein